MDSTTASSSLVERKKYDDRTAHQVAPGIWWVGFMDPERNCSYNPWLIVEGEEAALINPGSRADKPFQAVNGKVTSIVEPTHIHHLIVLHNDPDRCASLPLFEKTVGRDVRLYAPSASAASIRHYGCRHPVIGLDDGDSIIFKSGRTLDYFSTPNLPWFGSGILFDSRTRTIFCGSILGHTSAEWNLFCPAGGWQNSAFFDADVRCSKKALIHALNRIERLGPERLCPHSGPVIEEDIEGCLAAFRKAEPNK